MTGGAEPRTGWRPALAAAPRTGWRTALALLLALLVHACPSLAAALVYDRSAVQAGELWRLVGAHWVHLSGAHLAANAVALGTAGWLLERRAPHRLVGVLLLAAVAIGLAIHLTAPAVQRYAGLSGLACAVLAWLAADRLAEGPPALWLGLAVIAVLVAKTALEAHLGTALVAASVGDPALRPLALGHAVGTAVGMLHRALGCARARGRRRALRRAAPGSGVPLRLRLTAPFAAGYQGSERDRADPGAQRSAEQVGKAPTCRTAACGSDSSASPPSSPSGPAALPASPRS